MFNSSGALFLQTIFLIANQEQHNNSVTPSKQILFKNENYLQENTKEMQCYGVLGCYSVKYPWTDVSRPVALFPEPVEKINPKFCLYTRATNKTCEQLLFNDTNSLLTSSFLPSHKVYFISHGFLDTGNKPWIKLITLQLLRHLPCNVIVINWEGGSSPPYSQAVANIRLVGTITAHLIERLHTVLGVKTEFVHIIGHSLGAHLAGYAGNILQTKFNLTLGRISGMDPAEPHFSETDPVVRLDPSDGIFVDIIHTNIKPFIQTGLGMDEPIGHLDFYPNGGENQPGCDRSIGSYVNLDDMTFVHAVRRFLGCDHVRSYVYFIESINKQCSFLAIECDSWENFKEGKCFTCEDELYPDGLKCARLGFHSVKAIEKEAVEKGKFFPVAERSMVKLYTITGSQYPFCRALYRVTIIISNSNVSLEENGEVGMFSVDIKGIEGQTGILPFLDERYYKPGSTHVEVIGGSHVGRIRTVTLSWKHRTVPFNPFTWRLMNAVIHLDRIIVDSLEENSSTTFCPDQEEIYSGTPVELKPCTTTIINPGISVI